jgi:ABC-type spermidine/putrescine transport system permease subunit II
MQRLRVPIQVLPLGTLLAAACAVPLGILFVYSFWQISNFVIVHDWTLDNYRSGLLDGYYLRLLARSLATGAAVGAIAVAVAYPFAYAARFRFTRLRNVLLFAVLLSMFASYLVRVYAFQSILGRTGVINWLLQEIGIVDQPLDFLLFNRFAVIVTLTNVFLPFVLLPIWASMQNVDPASIVAARDLGARPWTVFWKIVVPATRRAALAGFAFAFVLASGDYVTPTLVGGTDGLMIGKPIANSFGLTNNYPLGSALAYSMLLLFALVVLVVPRLLRRPLRALRTAWIEHRPTVGPRLDIRIPGAHLWPYVWVPAVLAFLFAPLVIVVVLSFTTRDVPAFPMGGVTLRWYGNVLGDEQFSSALMNSIKLAVFTGVAASLLATLAALGLTRHRFVLKPVVEALMLVPLALPGLITGVAMLTLYTWAHIPLSVMTIGIGHLVFATPFVVLVMMARLRDLDPLIAEAGRDLGATPLGVFRRVTLPLIAPAMIGGGLVAAALSLDEFVITNFVSGSNVTLPLFIWSKLRIGVTPDVNAVSTLILVSLALLVVAFFLLGGSVGRGISRARTKTPAS